MGLSRHPPPCPRDACPMQRQTGLSRHPPPCPRDTCPLQRQTGLSGHPPACRAATDTLSSALGAVSLLTRTPRQRGTLALILTQAEIIYRLSRRPQKSAHGRHEGSFTHKDTLYLPFPCRERPGDMGQSSEGSGSSGSDAPRREGMEQTYVRAH